MATPPITNEGSTLPPSISSTFASVSRWSVLVRELKASEISLDLSTALEQILRLIQSVGDEYAAGVFLLDESARVVHGSITDMFDRSLYAGRGGLAETMRSSAPYILSDLPVKPRPLAAGEVAPAQPRAQIVTPFHLTGQGRGAIVVRSTQPKAFSAADGDALARFAQAASSRIENALLRRKMLQVGDEEVERDLVMAQEIMARLIPRKAPVIPRFDVASAYVPAKVVGGDLVDFISLRDDHYGFLVADVSGNGIPSALLMTGFRALFRGLIKNDFTIRSVFRKLNNQLFIILLLMVACFFTWSENVNITRAIKVVGRMGVMISSILIYFKIIRYGSINSLEYKNIFSPILYICYLILGFISFSWSTNPGFSALQWFMTFQSFVFAYFFVKSLKVLDVYFEGHNIRLYHLQIGRAHV